MFSHSLGKPQRLLLDISIHDRQICLEPTYDPSMACSNSLFRLPFFLPSWPHTNCNPQVISCGRLQLTLAIECKWIKSVHCGLRRLHDSLSYLLPLACWYFMWAGWNWLWSGWDFKLLICSLILKGLKRCYMFWYNFSTSINFCHMCVSKNEKRMLIHCY